MKPISIKTNRTANGRFDWIASWLLNQVIKNETRLSCLALHESLAVGGSNTSFRGFCFSHFVLENFD